MGESILKLQQIRKSFDHTEVLKGVDLEVAQGEFITLLGASGCGKTTTLRIIAGLELPDSGSVILEGRDITDWEPNKRDVNNLTLSYTTPPTRPPLLAPSQPDIRCLPSRILKDTQIYRTPTKRIISFSVLMGRA